MVLQEGPACACFTTWCHATAGGAVMLVVQRGPRCDAPFKVSRMDRHHSYCLDDLCIRTHPAIPPDSQLHSPVAHLIVFGLGCDSVSPGGQLWSRFVCQRFSTIPLRLQALSAGWTLCRNLHRRHEAVKWQSQFRQHGSHCGSTADQPQHSRGVDPLARGAH